MAAEAGRRFGPYEIRSMLGAGGMGEVYVARDRKLDRDVALKLLPIDFAADADRLRRFELEARSASALNHPAIPAIYDFGNADGQPYISMELVHGQTVRQLLASGALPPKRALHIAAQIADGLAKAHDAGIVHRDLKPENLMVTDDGFAKILDFGLAKLVADTDEHRQTIAKEGTVPGSVMGTAGYMSPEQAAGQLADGRSDQFSFGLVLYELLTGTRAFDRPTPAERMSAIIRDEPTPIEQLNRAIPAPVRWIVERCLAKHPGERYASTRDLARDLANARDHLSEIATAAADAATLRTTRPTLREYGAWALAALLALLSGGLAFRSFAAPQPPAPSPLRFTISPPEQHAFAGGIGSSPFALSADGRRLAFLASGPDGRSQVWVRSFDSLDARSLPGTDGAFNPFWSPDGQSVGFFVGGRLKRVSLAGGDVATICDARSGGGASWNQAGTIVFADGLDGVLKQVPAAGGTASALTALDSSRGDNAHLHPVFHTDGRHYLFSILSSTAGGIYLGSLDSREIRKLIDGALAAEFAAPDVLAFIQGDRLLAQHLDVNRAVLAGTPVRIADGIDVNGPNASFSASPAGSLVYAPGSENVTQPSWFSRDGTAEATLGPPGTYVNLAISPDGTQVAIDRFTPTPAIWILNVARGTTTRETPGGLVYQSTPVWSPDGRTIVYALAASRPPNLFLKRVGSDTESEPLFQATYQSFPQSWSPDGEYILYATVEPKTGQDIWRVPTRDPRTPSPLIRTQYAESHPRISPDGRWLAYASNDGGRLDIYAVRLPGVDGKRVISTAGGNFPVWGRDGRELYYLSREGMVMAVAMRTDAGGGLSAGTPVSLFKAPPLTGGPGAGTPYDVAPDGRFLFNVFQRRTSPPVTVVLDWRPTEQPLSR